MKAEETLGLSVGAVESRERAVRQVDLEVITDAILAAGQRTRVRVIAQAVLADHVHAIVGYQPDATLSAFAREAKSESARRVNERRGAGLAACRAMPWG